jgi:hypothetical protein
MRLLLTSYQKSGTHQIYPMFIQDTGQSVGQLIDKAHLNIFGTEAFGNPPIDNLEEKLQETAAEIGNFTGKRFGHIAYHPLYGEATRTQPTKVVFNVRDPRDVVVSEYENLLRVRAGGGARAEGLWNVLLPDEGKHLIDSSDPIGWLIRLAAARWPNWLGWMDEDNVALIHYEDLRLRTPSTVTELREWLLGVGMPTYEWMVNRAGNRKAVTFRKGLIGEHKNYFNEGHWRLSDKLLTPILERLGYDREGLMIQEFCLYTPERRGILAD